MKAEYRPLTQEELLAEAAQTELENTASVAALMAAEEEIKARAAARKAKYCGPLLRYHSLKIDGESVVCPLPRSPSTYMFCGAPVFCRHGVLLLAVRASFCLHGV